MLTHLRFANFRGFRSLDVDIASITAFLGPNSSGKTTALHAIRLACDALRLALDDARPAKRDQEEKDWLIVAERALVDPQRLLPLADWRALFVDQAVGEGVYFQINLTFADDNPVQEVQVRVDCARNEQLKLTVRVRSADALETIARLPRKSPIINQKLNEFLRQHAPVAVFVPPFYGTITDEEARARVVIDRLLGSGDQSHVVRNLVAALEPEQYIRLNAFLQEAVGATLTYRTSGDLLETESPMRVRFRDSDGDLELSAAGAGLVNLVALYSSLSRWRREAAERTVLFLVDEPEAHLHPRLQAESTAFLGRVATQEFGAQFLIATHSVDILNRLASDGHRLLRCDRRVEPSAVILDRDSDLFDDLAEWVDLTPYTAINFLAARRVLFVEGLDDQTLLPFLGELRYRNDAARLARFRQWAVVKLEGAANKPVADLLARLVRSDVIRARAKVGGFRVMVALDRDHERTPGETTECREQVTQTTFVWSAHSIESLFTEPAVLVRWVRAHLGDMAPADLESRVGEAVALVNRDDELKRNAVSALTASLVMAQERAGARIQADHGAVVRTSADEAQRRVDESPATWQRGKDRARFILRRLREGFPTWAQAHFPTDLCRLVAQTDRNRVGDSLAAIPVEVATLLDRMTRE